ncbi:MAG: hypothetical protein U0Q15_15260 [Kineosporiaceae bacterium]
MKRSIVRAVAVATTLTALSVGGLTQASPANAASLSCTKTYSSNPKTKGYMTCTTSGGAVYVKKAYADCNLQSDPEVKDFTINGTWSHTFECRYRIDGMYIVW